MSSITKTVSEAVSTALAAGANVITAIREATGYSVEDLAITSGLAVDELSALEHGNDTDTEKLRRIASPFGVPESLFTQA